MAWLGIQEKIAYFSSNVCRHSNSNKHEKQMSSDVAVESVLGAQNNLPLNRAAFTRTTSSRNLRKWGNGSLNCSPGLLHPSGADELEGSDTLALWCPKGYGTTCD